MKISPATAARVLSMLKYHGTPESAAHDARISLRAIEPYTDRATSRALDVLEFMGRHPDKRDQHLEVLNQVAGGSSNEPRQS